MKLQKLLFFAYGWYWVEKDQPLFNEKIQAWKYGPVIPSVYHKVKVYGTNPIIEKIRDIQVKDNSVSFTTPELDPEKDKYEIEFLDFIWELYSKFSPIQLANLSHVKGGPWDKVSSQFSGQIPPDIDIDDSLIKEYFNTLNAQAS
jgi:uncharacterized phage-associated protein